jgi:NAD(P)-dependent dehydrogenase (short-subunit alcohol dehydrogenase family)
MTSPKNQAALVTGSGRGIGFAIALRLAQQGFGVALNDIRDSLDLQSAVEKLRAYGGAVEAVVGDVSDIAGHKALIEQAEAGIGPLTTLVNNAGVSVLARGDILDVTEESYDRCMAVNAKAHFFLTQAFVRTLLGRQRSAESFCSIVNVTSANAEAVAVQRAEYCASKAAAAMISKTFAVRLGAENIAVFDVRPGLIETEMTRGVKDAYQHRINVEGLTLIPRLGQPEDIGRIVATLATGGLPYMTGQVLSADAGMLVSRF